MRIGIVSIGALVGGILLYVAVSTLLGIVGKEPWMSICFFASIIVAGILTYLATRQLAVKKPDLVKCVSSGIRKTFGVFTLFLGAIILVWVIYNFFSPTLEFRSSYKGIFQIAFPLVMIWVGWEWLTRKPAIPSRYPHFVFAKIYDPIGPLDRGVKYGEPLNNILTEHGIGEVTGGGTEMTEDGRIDWIGLDIHLADLANSLQFTRQRLRELGAPKGSVMEYQEDDKEIVLPINEK